MAATTNRSAFYSTENLANTARIQHFGPLGRRAFSRTRVQLTWVDSVTNSATQAPTIRVADAFTIGGAQLAGGSHSKDVNVGSDLDYVLGRHSIRTGVLFDAAWLHSDATSNYLGTYTFDNLAAYLANEPSNYTRRLGDPNIAYQMVQGGVYVQDDIRVLKNLTLTPGVRYELQSHVRENANVGPRFGMTWAPFASGQTTLRSSIGTFYDWLPNSTYEQTLRVDGLHQQELNIVDPSYPDPGTAGVVPLTNKYILGDNYRAPRTTRVSAGIDQGFLKVVRVSATYSYQNGARLSRGLNLNAPVDGVRPNPAFANIIEVGSDAGLRQHQLQVDANINPGALLPAFNGPLISWKRTTVFANYTLASVRNNTDGPFSVPATGNLAGRNMGTELRRTRALAVRVINGVPIGGAPVVLADVRNRLNVTFNNQVIRKRARLIDVEHEHGPAVHAADRQRRQRGRHLQRSAASVGRNTLRASGTTSSSDCSRDTMFAFGHIAPLPPGTHPASNSGGEAARRTGYARSTRGPRATACSSTCRPKI